MKTTSILIGSTSIFAALAVAIPVPSSTDTVQIVLKTGDGDAARGFAVTINQLFSTKDNPQVSSGVAASIDDKTAICQAFSDNAAKIPLGAPFTAAKPGSFSDTSNGGIGSVPSDAVPIGAYLCSRSADGLKGSSGSSATARVQLETESDTFFQNDVPADGSIFLTAKSNFGTTGLDLDLVDATGVDVNLVSCQAFADVAATHPIGGPATAKNGGAILTADRNHPATLNAIVCSVSA